MGWREEGGFNPNDYDVLLDYVTALREFEHARDYLPRHPELYTYLSDPDGWMEMAVHPEMQYAKRTDEWNFVLQEPATDVFVFPLLKADFCRLLIEESEHFDHYPRYDEGPNRKDANYATTDVRLASMPQPGTGEAALNEGYTELLKDYIAPVAKAVWKYDLTFYQWPFLARYTPSEQPFLGFHHDDATMALVVSLNEEGADFEGGGTFFERGRFHHRNVPVGYASLHPSRLTHRHGAKAVTAGARYVLNAFID